MLNEAGSNYSFKGLMRKLNLHQQSLSRALHRLEEMGLIEKSPVGYQLSKDGGSAISRVDLPSPKGREYMQLLQSYIPLNFRRVEIVRQLAGRWFKNLRWIGMIDSGTGYTLQWSGDDGSFQINLRMISDYIVIETNAYTEQEKVDAMVGSYAIYEQITKAMQSTLRSALHPTIASVVDALLATVWTAQTTFPMYAVPSCRTWIKPRSRYRRSV